MCCGLLTSGRKRSMQMKPRLLPPLRRRNLRALWSVSLCHSSVNSCVWHQLSADTSGKNSSFKSDLQSPKLIIRFTVDRNWDVSQNVHLINVSRLLVKDVIVFLISSWQVVREGHSAQTVSADSLLNTEASWDSSQCEQTGWPANAPPAASPLHRSPRSASLLGLPVPQYSAPHTNTSLVWKAQSKGIAGWVPLSVLLILPYGGDCTNVICHGCISVKGVDNIL